MYFLWPPLEFWRAGHGVTGHEHRRRSLKKRIAQRAVERLEQSLLAQLCMERSDDGGTRVEDDSDLSDGIGEVYVQNVCLQALHFADEPRRQRHRQRSGDLTMAMDRDARGETVTARVPYTCDMDFYFVAPLGHRVRNVCEIAGDSGNERWIEVLEDVDDLHTVAPCSLLPAARGCKRPHAKSRADRVGSAESVQSKAASPIPARVASLA